MGNRNGAFGGSGGGEFVDRMGLFWGVGVFRDSFGVIGEIWGQNWGFWGSGGEFGDRNGAFRDPGGYLGGPGGYLGTGMGLSGGPWVIWGSGGDLGAEMVLLGVLGAIWGHFGVGGGQIWGHFGVGGIFWGKNRVLGGGGLRGIWGSEDSVNANFEVLEVFRGRFGAISGDFGAVPGSGRAPPAAISHRWRRSVLPPPLYGRPSPPKRRPRPPPRPLYPPRLYGSSPSVAWRGKGEGCVTSGGALRFRCVSLVPAGGRRR